MVYIIAIHQSTHSFTHLLIQSLVHAFTYSPTNQFPNYFSFSLQVMFRYPKNTFPGSLPNSRCRPLLILHYLKVSTRPITDPLRTMDVMDKNVITSFAYGGQMSTISSHLLMLSGGVTVYGAIGLSRKKIKGYNTTTNFMVNGATRGQRDTMATQCLI